MHCSNAPAIVERWPLAEVLTIYIEIKTEWQLTQWRHACLLWQIRAAAPGGKPGPKPEMPALVKRRYDP